MNDREQMAKSLLRLKGRGAAAGAFLDALAAMKAGDDSAAQAKVLALAEAAGDRDLMLKSLWVLYAAADSRGDEKAASELRARLRERFPGAPETVMATRATAATKRSVILLPNPDEFTNAVEVVSTAPAPDLPAPTEPTPAVLSAPSPPPSPAAATSPDASPAAVTDAPSSPVPGAHGKSPCRRDLSRCG